MFNKSEQNHSDKARKTGKLLRHGEQIRQIVQTWRENQALIKCISREEQEQPAEENFGAGSSIAGAQRTTTEVARRTTPPQRPRQLTLSKTTLRETRPHGARLTTYK